MSTSTLGGRAERGFNTRPGLAAVVNILAEIAILATRLGLIGWTVAWTAT